MSGRLASQGRIGLELSNLLARIVHASEVEDRLRSREKIGGTLYLANLSAAGILVSISTGLITIPLDHEVAGRILTYASHTVFGVASLWNVLHVFRTTLLKQELLVIETGRVFVARLSVAAASRCKLVDINTTSLGTYYALIKLHAKRTLCVALTVGIGGLVLILVGLVTGSVERKFVTSYMIGSVGMLTELIGTILGIFMSLPRLRERILRAVARLGLPCVVVAVLRFANPFVLAIFAGYAVIALMLACGAYSMLYGRRLSVLVLRRFRSTAINRMIVRSFKHSLKRRYRLVTLDDATFPQIGLPATIRATVNASLPVFIFIVILTPVLGFLLYPPVPLIGASPMLGIVLLFGVWFMFPAILANVWILLLFVAFVSVHRFRVYRRATLEVSSLADVPRIVDVFRELSSWYRASSFMAAQSTLIRVENSVWREAVRSAAAVADRIVIDVSEMTESVRWEVRYCVETHGPKCLIVGKADSSRARGAVAPGAPPLGTAGGDRAATTRVLGYDSASRNAMQQFAWALRKDLDGIFDDSRGKTSDRKPAGLGKYIANVMVTYLLTAVGASFVYVVLVTVVFGSLAGAKAGFAEKLWSNARFLF